MTALNMRAITEFLHFVVVAFVVVPAVAKSVPFKLASFSDRNRFFPQEAKSIFATSNGDLISPSEPNL